MMIWLAKVKILWGSTEKLIYSVTKNIFIVHVLLAEVASVYDRERHFVRASLLKSYN